MWANKARKEKERGIRSDKTLMIPAEKLGYCSSKCNRIQQRTQQNMHRNILNILPMKTVKMNANNKAIK